jgi:hypothetical protein
MDILPLLLKKFLQSLPNVTRIFKMASSPRIFRFEVHFSAEIPGGLPRNSNGILPGPRSN